MAQCEVRRLVPASLRNAGAVRAGLGKYFEFYNTKRRHSALDRRTPDAVYYDQANVKLVA